MREVTHRRRERRKYKRTTEEDGLPFSLPFLSEHPEQIDLAAEEKKGGFFFKKKRSQSLGGKVRDVISSGSRSDLFPPLTSWRAFQGFFFRGGERDLKVPNPNLFYSVSHKRRKKINGERVAARWSFEKKKNLGEIPAAYTAFSLISIAACYR